MPLYPIDQTAHAVGVARTSDPCATAAPRARCLRDALRAVGAAAIDCETFTENNGANLRVAGTYAHVCAGGHLVLQPGGVDLRIIPGTVDTVDFHDPGAGLRQRAVLLSGGRAVHRATFRLADGSDTLSDWRGRHALSSRRIALPSYRADDSIEALWRALTDIHHFEPMLRSRGIERLAAYRTVPEDLACCIPTDAVRALLYALDRMQMTFMAFVGNAAVVQIFTGRIVKLVELPRCGQLILHGRTQNGSAAVLRLSERAVAEVWLVRHFSRDGPIESLEVFDGAGKLLVQFFDARTEGRPQSAVWQRLLGELKGAAAGWRTGA
ncbi:ChuX/HutX family heme-like substrate-binding protein [Chitinasiproducens palmae]|uniref:ChuX/HutX family heme-like substrate-binding protein n=1 Tax=Chitinasiproducens palmae TaxID=1770053 RepID=UPI001113AD4A|nr:ChuX/HutX family heme-like substrate-binding protein [Chitinasiproducens palmae]